MSGTPVRFGCRPRNRAVSGAFPSVLELWAPEDLPLAEAIGRAAAELCDWLFREALEQQRGRPVRPLRPLEALARLFRRTT